jgi:hypothetical protein
MRELVQPDRAELAHQFGEAVGLHHMAEVSKHPHQAGHAHRPGLTEVEVPENQRDHRVFVSLDLPVKAAHTQRLKIDLEKYRPESGCVRGVASEFNLSFLVATRVVDPDSDPH